MDGSIRTVKSWRALMLCAISVGMMALLGCSPPWHCPDPYIYSETFIVTGKAAITGPLPVYSTYNGQDPLATTLRAGLFKPGSSLVAGFLQLAVDDYTHWDMNYNDSCTISGYLYEYGVPAGLYDVGIYTKQDPNSWSEQNSAESGIVLYRGPQVNVDYSVDSQTLAPMELNFTGPGPYGSVSGRILISGPALYAPITQLVLKPETPAQGVSADTGLLWYADYHTKRHGQIWYTVPALSYGNYELSYAGSWMHDRNHPETFSSFPISISADKPNQSGFVFNTAVDQEPNPQWKLGRISGQLVLPAVPAPDSAYCVETRRSDVPDIADSSTGYDYRVTQWCLISADFDAAHMAEFDSGWLDIGAYQISVYALANTPDGEDTLLGSFGPYNLSDAALNIEDAVLEIAP